MSSHKKIVVIEDNHDLSSVVQELLSEKGYDVATADTGESGLTLVQEQKPSLLLLDSRLPGMSGLEVLEALQEFRKNHELKIIILSNVDDPVELRAAREYGIDEYLIKTDWRMEDVVSTVKKHI